jgi:hypothetical protein
MIEYIDIFLCLIAGIFFGTLLIYGVIRRRVRLASFGTVYKREDAPIRYWLSVGLFSFCTILAIALLAANLVSAGIGDRPASGAEQGAVGNEGHDGAD